MNKGKEALNKEKLEHVSGGQDIYIEYQFQCNSCFAGGVQSDPLTCCPLCGSTDIVITEHYIVV